MLTQRLLRISFLLCSTLLLTSCDIFTYEPHLPPTTISSTMYPTLSRYIGMSEERVGREMSKIQGVTIRKDGYNLIVTREGDFGYIITIRREVEAVVFNKYYSDRNHAVNDLTICSNALFRIGTPGADYLGKFNNREFTLHSTFVDYLNNNKGRYPAFVASEFRMAVIDGNFIPADWTTSISPYGSDISVMVGYFE